MSDPWGSQRPYRPLLSSSRLLAMVTLAAGLCAPALAADPPARVASPAAPAVPAQPVLIDFAFGAALMTDYNFRGVSQTDRRPAVQAYGEFQFWDDLLYAGAFVSSVDLPSRPDAEIDFYGGIRPSFGPLAFDLGFIHYYYPNEIAGVDTDFTEIVGKVSYEIEPFTIGANVFHAWDLLQTGAAGTYGSLTAEVALPWLEGLSVSGELGHYWLGRTSAALGSVDLPDYTYWNVGASYSYNAVTLDLRYHDTDLSRTQCFDFTGDPRGAITGRSRWCGAAFVAKLSVDLKASEIGVFAPR